MSFRLEPQQGLAQGWAHNTQEVVADWLVGPVLEAVGWEVMGGVNGERDVSPLVSVS